MLWKSEPDVGAGGSNTSRKLPTSGSLEEIELEYPTSEGDGEEEFDEPVQHSDRNPFAHIIGPLMRSDDGIV